jgi:hypothetical protein
MIDRNHIVTSSPEGFQCFRVTAAKSLLSAGDAIQALEAAFFTYMMYFAGIEQPEDARPVKGESGRSSPSNRKCFT